MVQAGIIFSGGGIHGAYEVIGGEISSWKERFLSKYRVKKESISYKFGQIILTFLLVDFAWIFFRSNSLNDAFGLIGRIITKWDPWVLFDQSLYSLGLNQTEIHILCISLVILLMVDLVRYRYQKTLDVFLKEQCLWFSWGAIFILFFIILIYGIYGPTFDAKQFIYFQF